ncbi:UNVERIFIED_CONTAM: hypothetical protein HDU68_006194, partial [Siphonaria sp. JEL0065]
MSSDFVFTSTADPHSDKGILHAHISPTATTSRKRKKNRKRPKNLERLLVQSRDSIEAAKRRAKRAAAASAAAAVASGSVTGASGGSNSLDLGRDAFMQLMRESGLGNRSFRIITREDLLFGNQDYDNEDDGDNEQEDYPEYYNDDDPAFDGIQSELSYEGNDYDDEDDSWMGHAESGADDSMDDDDLDNPMNMVQPTAAESGDEIVLSELEEEIARELADAGIGGNEETSTNSGRSSNNGAEQEEEEEEEDGESEGNAESRSSDDSSFIDAPKMLMQVYGEDGFIIGTPLVVYENASRERAYRPVDVTPRP